MTQDDCPDSANTQTPRTSFGKKVFWGIRFAVFAALCASIGFFGVSIAGNPVARELFSPDFLKAWWHVGKGMRLAQVNYYEEAEVTPQKVSGGALTGIARRLDKYSRYLPREDYEAFNQRTSQTYTGIGATLRMLDGRATITRVFSGGGAAECGLKAGDQILEADGTPIREISRRVIEERISGREGTSVRLLVARPGAAAVEYSVQRRVVSVPTVSSKRMLADGSTAYMRIDNFESRTATEAAEALREFEKSNAKRLVLDLRDNPGGLVSTAIGVAGLFCPNGTVIVTARGRRTGEGREYVTQQEPVAPNLPLVVLVNRESASASEIVSGALQDLKRAVVVGDRTFGKGVVQTVYSMGEHDALQLTTSRYVLPSGRSIQGNGVQPDVWLPADPAAAELAELASVLRETGRQNELVARFGVSTAEDPQIAAAAEIARLLGKGKR